MFIIIKLVILYFRDGSRKMVYHVHSERRARGVIVVTATTGCWRSTSIVVTDTTGSCGLPSFHTTGSCGLPSFHTTGSCGLPSFYTTGSWGCCRDTTRGCCRDTTDTIYSSYRGVTCWFYRVP